MTHDEKFFEWIEDYCQDNLPGSEKSEFETELRSNEELREEMMLERELCKAISENDILDLREKLQQVAVETRRGTTPFQLLEGFEAFHTPEDLLPPKALLDYFESLPKAHIYQHELVKDEVIHEFYLEQERREAEALGEFESESDPEGFPEGLEEAILESDIINLRDTLAQVANATREHFSTEEIDRYLNKEMTSGELTLFEKEHSANRMLQREINIHRELEEAVMELDIINLREEIALLTTRESSWNVSNLQIEKYLEGQLEGEELETFNHELTENKDLKSEIVFRHNLNHAISEEDVINLRNKLDRVKQEVKIKELKSVIPETKSIPAYIWKTAVAVVAVMLLFSTLFNSSSGTYNHVYESPQWSPQRSVSSGMDLLQQANIHYMNGAFEEAIAIYDVAIKTATEDPFVFHFYKGASFQNLGNYKDAIPEYTQVIGHGDNLFVEEAEWYRALCYLKLGDQENTRKQLLAIREKNGFYAGKAKAILKKNRFTFR